MGKRGHPGHAHPGYGTTEQGHQSAAYIVSCMTMLLGYCLFVMGVVSPAWRWEIGYTYGLWVRCDEGVCQYSFAGFTNYLALVQSCIITSLLVMTSSTLCLLLEGIMKTCHVSTKHVIRAERMVVVTAAVGEILAAFSLGFYGCQTVMTRERLPVLASGFALTGLGVIVSLIGNILKVMGPPETWGDGMCCLAPRKRYLKNLPLILYDMQSDAPVAKTNQGSSGFKARTRGNDKETVGLISCFHDNKNGYSYSSVPSTISSSLDRGYRHYEEISFDDMPPPPLEMLNQFPPMNPLSNLPHNYVSEISPQEHISHDRTTSLAQHHSITSSPLRYFESKAHPQQHHADTFMTDQPPERQIRQSGFAPQVAPRQINQQRSIIKSAQRHNHPTTSDRQTLPRS